MTKNIVTMTRIGVALFAAASFFIQAMPGQTISFEEQRIAYPAIGTVALATGDFNGDGIVDTLVAIPFGVAVYPGHIQGALGTPITTKLPVSCTSYLLAADFNKDGKLDFACVVSSSFQVALGNGDGTFRTPISSSDSGLDALVGADFNGDGIPDLASYSNSFIDVYLGKGDGTFRAPVTTALNKFTIASLHPADVNGDGKADLVATGSNTVGVLLGKGDGTFALPTFTILPKVSSADSTVTGDMNGDGLLDIVVAVNKAATNLPIAHIAVLLQQAGGTFVPAYYTTPNPLSALELGDVNGDGLLDVVGLRTYGPSALTILEGEAGGILGSPASYETPVKAFNLANPRHEPVPDIIYTDSNTLVLLPNQGNGVFVPGIQVQGGVSTSPCLTGDFNNDGNPDLACLDSYLITILHGTGNKSQPFGRPVTIELIGPASSIALGDFNSDGNLDIVAALVDNSIQFIENEGNAGFVQLAQRSAGGTGLNVMAAGDFNKDGKLDLVTGGGNFLAGNGDGTFEAPAAFYPGTFGYFGVADLNGDGTLDLFGVPGGEKPPIALLGLGNGMFNPFVLTGINGSYNPVIADLNGDGALDVVIPAANFGVTILLNNGSGVFTQQPPIFNDFWPPTISVAVGDFNGDGKPDVAFGIASGAVFPVVGNGNGTFGPTTTGASVEDATSLLALSLGIGNSDKMLVAGSSVITVLEPR